MVTLHALLVRRPGLDHDQFLAHWHEVHGPLIRDTPALARHLLSYHQHPVQPAAADLGPTAYDGVTVQTFTGWDAFWAFATQPESQVMHDDMATFIDVSRLQVTVTADPVTVLDRGGHR